jgi:hypothetical protein
MLLLLIPRLTRLQRLNQRPDSIVPRIERIERARPRDGIGRVLGLGVSGALGGGRVGLGWGHDGYGWTAGSGAAWGRSRTHVDVGGTKGG